MAMKAKLFFSSVFLLLFTYVSVFIPSNEARLVGGGRKATVVKCYFTTGGSKGKGNVVGNKNEHGGGGGGSSSSGDIRSGGSRSLSTLSSSSSRSTTSPSSSGGNANADDNSSSGGIQQYPPFYIPAVDRELYQNGVEEMLLQMGASKDNLTVHCSDNFDINVDCKVCLYNEVSEDKTHMRQGQVLGVDLMNCMEGRFSSGGRMSSSEFHPICYPPVKETAEDKTAAAAAAAGSTKIVGSQQLKKESLENLWEMESDY